MSSGPAKYELLAFLKKPKPSCNISRTPPADISSPLDEWLFKIVKMTSCFLSLPTFSAPIFSAIDTSSCIGFSFSSVRFILF